jgi:hypothetical protein
VRADRIVGRAMTARRLLLSEGSSLSAREAITALGLAGHRVDVCDPDPRCLGRFSRFVGRVHRCPSLGVDPAGYLAFVIELLAAGGHDVLVPIHEQAYLFAKAAHLIPRGVAVALAPAASFDRVQTKPAFAELLTELALPQPETRVCRTAAELLEPRPYPCFVKAAYGTATTGVTHVRSRADHLEIAAQLDAAGAFADGVVVQAPAAGALERTQAVFRRGALVALHAYRQLEAGVGGGDVRKVSVHRAVVRTHVERIGRALAWHGALSLDYFWDDTTATPRYFDANPRLVEPMNGVRSGVNLADVLVAVSTGEAPRDIRTGRSGVRTHLGIMALLSAARDTSSRRAVVTRALDCVLRRGAYADSCEEVTPLVDDAPSAVAFAYVLGSLVVAPRSWRRRAARTVASYALTPAAARFARDFGPSGDRPAHQS